MWDDQKRADVIEAYEEANPTADTSIEILQEIAEDFEESVNGVRMILIRAGVYIKKEQKTTKSKGTGGGRVSKKDSQATLTAAIVALGQEADDEIINKLTGKAAVYLAGIINSIAK